MGLGVPQGIHFWVPGFSPSAQWCHGASYCSDSQQILAKCAGYERCEAGRPVVVVDDDDGDDDVDDVVEVQVQVKKLHLVNENSSEWSWTYLGDPFCTKPVNGDLNSSQNIPPWDMFSLWWDDVWNAHNNDETLWRCFFSFVGSAELARLQPIFTLEDASCWQHVLQSMATGSTGGNGMSLE